jgi:phosphoglycolate phosphatase-like HAD superfamily hydrolase
MQLVMDGFGRSRSHHIRSFYEDLLGQPIGVEDLEAEVARFTEICEPLCARAPWRSGSREFVAACREAGIPRYVLSGTPQAPLEAMLASTGAAGYFDRIVGSPPAKPESLGKLVSGAGVGPDHTVFVGDAEADRAAAEAVGTHFVYFPSEANPPKGPVATRVTDLRELLV